MTATTYITSSVAPAVQYWDLEGLLVHEFGHFAGLAHSLVEGEYVGVNCTQSTMYPCANAQIYTRSTAFHAAGSCSITTTVQLNNVSLLARHSRTLEMDDLAALGRAYPRPAFQNMLGTISGIIQDEPVSTENGANLVAISTSSPAATRIGNVVHTDGTYSIAGLPAGTYHLLVEPIETARAWVGNLNSIPDPTGTTWFFSPSFSDGDPPYPYQQFVGTVPWDPTSAPCLSGNTPWRLFEPELFTGSGEDTGYPARNCETSPSLSQLLTVAAGSSTTANLSLAQGNIPGVTQTGECCQANCGGAEHSRHHPTPLWVGIKTNIAPAVGNLSAHGLGYGPIAAGFTLSFLVAGPLVDDMGASWEGAQVTLRLSTSLDAFQRPSPDDGEVQLIKQAGAVKRTGTLNSNSLASFDFAPNTFPPAPLPANFATIYAQAEIVEDANFPGLSMLTNVVKVTVIR